MVVSVNKKPRHWVTTTTAASVTVVFERPGAFDWEVLADADAELHAWLANHHEEALAMIDASAEPANDNGGAREVAQRT
jgi:hypothetical protein